MAHKSDTTHTQQEGASDGAQSGERRKFHDQGATGAESDENVEVNRKLAEYTCQLAVYTNKLAGFTQLLAWVTALLVFIGLWQGYSLYRSVEESSGQHRATNKAFVFLRYFGSMPVGVRKGKVDAWRITPIFENSGNTPTRHMISFHSASLRDTPLPAQFDFPDTPFPADGRKPTIGRDLMPPHAQLNGAPYLLRIDDLIAIQEGRKKFYIWGWIDYDDVFGHRHRFEYCYGLSILFDPRNPENNAALAMSLHGEHNGIDDECYRNPSPYVPP